MYRRSGDLLDHPSAQQVEMDIDTYAFDFGIKTGTSVTYGDDEISDHCATLTIFRCYRGSARKSRQFNHPHRTRS